MKKLMKLFYIGIAISLVACSSTQGMRVEVKRAARITVPSTIKNIALVNHAVPSKQGLVEGTLTGEMPKQDKELTLECLQGLNETLLTSDRFNVKRLDSSYLASDPASLRFASPMSWEKADSIAKSLGVEGLLVLEYFDTDFSIINPGATVNSTINNVLNGQQTPVEVKGSARAYAGFRIYDVKQKSIIYEDRFEYQRTWTQTSTNPVEAARKLIKRNDALYDVSYAAGKGFAMDIVPLYYWENRMLYKGKKKHREMTVGLRKALAKDWTGAIENWKTAYESSSKNKWRARAAYNIALGYEVLGDLTQAQKWIQTSYVEDGQDEAYQYGEIIDKLIREQSVLKIQTGQ